MLMWCLHYLSTAGYYIFISILNFQQIMNKTYHNLLPIGFASTPLRVTLVPMRELLFAISIKLVHSIRNAHTHTRIHIHARNSINMIDSIYTYILRSPTEPDLWKADIDNNNNNNDSKLIFDPMFEYKALKMQSKYSINEKFQLRYWFVLNVKSDDKIYGEFKIQIALV